MCPGPELILVAQTAFGSERQVFSMKIHFQSAAAAALAAMFVLAGAVSAVPQTSNPATAKLLTIADVESVTGVKGVKLVPKDIRRGAGGDLNFAKTDGSLLVMLIAMPGMYDMWKSQKVLYNAAVSGVGDEAFNGPAGAIQYVIYFRKGKNSGSISSFVSPSDMKPVLSQDQLKALAKIVNSRM